MENHIVNLPQGAEECLIKSHEADQMTTPRPKVPGVNELESYQTPPREALQQIKPLVSPATISKNELNDAALTLKWLSEGWNTGDCKGQARKNGRRLSNSPQESSKKAKVMKTKSKIEANTPLDTKTSGEGLSFMEEKTPVNDGKTQHLETLAKSEPSIQLKSKRAASYKCAAMLKEALFEESKEKAEKKDFSIPKVSVQKVGKPKKTSPTGSDSARKRSRNYSENSRVGRAVQAIYQYIIKNQQMYLRKGARGVPERVIRVEYGNNPDTSKALRYLVTENRISREGVGGRKDPFSYTVKPVSVQSFMSQSQSPLLVSLGVPPTDLWASPHQCGPNDQPAAVVASLAEPSITNAFSPRGDEERSTIKSKMTVQPRLSFGEPVNQNSKINFDQTLKATAAPLNSVSPLAHLDPNNFLRSTMIANGGLSMNLLNEMTAKQTSMPPAMQASCLMQMQAAHLLWNQTLMAMNIASQNTRENQNHPTAARGDNQC